MEGSKKSKIGRFVLLKTQLLNQKTRQDLYTLQKIQLHLN